MQKTLTDLEKYIIDATKRLEEQTDSKDKIIAFQKEIDLLLNKIKVEKK